MHACAGASGALWCRQTLEAACLQQRRPTAWPLAAAHLHALQRLAVGVEVQLLGGVGAHRARAAARRAALLAARQGGGACACTRVAARGEASTARPGAGLPYEYATPCSYAQAGRGALRTCATPFQKAAHPAACWTASRSPSCKMHEQCGGLVKRTKAMVACSDGLHGSWRRTFTPGSSHSEA